ncbi:MAG: preprotein translocase subunit SecG [bacterium]
MYTLVFIVHVLVSLGMVFIVLLQQGKGTDIGSVFGGGGQNPLLGSRGAASFIGKVTVGCASVFMLTSLYLSINGRKFSKTSLLEEAAQEEAGKIRSDSVRPSIDTTVFPPLNPE